MATATRILDKTRFEARARVGDIVALGVLLVVGAALVFDMYTFGYTARLAEESGNVIARDRRFIRMLMEAFLAACSLGWIAFRLFTASARRVGG